MPNAHKIRYQRKQQTIIWWCWETRTAFWNFCPFFSETSTPTHKNISSFGHCVIITCTLNVLICESKQTSRDDGKIIEILECLRVWWWWLKSSVYDDDGVIISSNGYLCWLLWTTITWPTRVIGFVWCRIYSLCCPGSTKIV